MIVIISMKRLKRALLTWAIAVLAVALAVMLVSRLVAIVDLMR